MYFQPQHVSQINPSANKVRISALSTAECFQYGTCGVSVGQTKFLDSLPWRQLA